MRCACALVFVVAGCGAPENDDSLLGYYENNGVGSDGIDVGAGSAGIVVRVCSDRATCSDPFLLYGAVPPSNEELQSSSASTYEFGYGLGGAGDCDGGTKGCYSQEGGIVLTRLTSTTIQLSVCVQARFPTQCYPTPPACPTSFEVSGSEIVAACSAPMTISGVRAQ